MGGYLEYPEYKDSGVEWLDKIPTHWQVVRISNVTSKITNGYVGPTRDILVDSGIRYIQSLHVKDGKILFDRGAYFVEEEWSNRHKKSRLNIDDVLLVQTGDIGQTAVVTEKYEGCNCHALIIMTPVKEKVTGRFFEFFLRSHTGQSVLKTLQTGALHPHLNCTLVKDVKFAVPPISEQETIARFLDYKTAQIDTLIAKKENLLAKLAEKRTALISQAVTKGLDPTVPMKDSGIEWLGDIPAQWTLLPLKYAVTFQRGHDLPAESRIEGDIPLISSSGLSGCHNVAVAKAPGIVTGRYGTIGKFTYVEEDYWALNTTLYSIRTYGNNVRFLWYMMHNLSALFLLNSQKSAVPGVDRNDLHPVLTVLPPVEEQGQIVEYIDRKIAEIDKQQAKVEEVISKLKEYRTALITNAVTGKIDVRDVKLPEADWLAAS